jgi:hypothetical protein
VKYRTARRIAVLAWPDKAHVVLKQAFVRALALKKDRPKEDVELP